MKIKSRDYWSRFTNNKIHLRVVRIFLHKVLRARCLRVVRIFLRKALRASKSFAKVFGIAILVADPSDSRKISISRFRETGAIKETLLRLRPIITQYPLVRLGNLGDGGYLVPDDLQVVEACFSAGCDLKWSFERDLFEKYKIISNIIDEESKRPADLPSVFSYTPAFLGIKNSPETIKFSDWVNNLKRNQNGNLMLQMDIEGSEWKLILEIPEDVLINFSILVIEFHNSENFRIARLFDGTYRPAIEKILRYFEPVHIHGNNNCGTVDFGNFQFPQVFEMTFLRKDRIVSSEGYCELPNPLDSKNVEHRDEIIFDW